jgi:large subunit ribosomal protein L6
MSRIGKKPVAVPTGVSVAIAGRTITMEKGGKKLQMTHRPEISVKWNEADRQVECALVKEEARDRRPRAYWGLTRSLVQNMVNGLTTGYTKKLEVVGVGWNAQAQGNKIILNVGYSKPVEIAVPSSVTMAVDKQFITLTSADKQAVGQLAATIKSKRKPEPYNGKGIRFVGEQIIRKEGKTVVGR